MKRMGECLACRRWAYDSGCVHEHDWRDDVNVCPHFLCEACDNTGYYGDTWPGVLGRFEQHPCDVCFEVKP